MTYGPMRTASAICVGRSSAQRRRHRARDVAARRRDLVAAGAVVGEEVLAPARGCPATAAAPGSAGPGPSDATYAVSALICCSWSSTRVRRGCAPVLRRAACSRCAGRSRPRARRRRAATAPMPFCTVCARSGAAPICLRCLDAGAVGAVAASAVAAVEVLARADAAGERRGRGAGGAPAEADGSSATAAPRTREGEQREQRGPHACLQTTLARAATPASRTIIRKITFASDRRDGEEADPRERRLVGVVAYVRASAGAPSTAAASATSTHTTVTLITTACQRSSRCPSARLRRRTRPG